MRIGIDARFYDLSVGIGRYTEKLITHLEKIDKVNDYFIFLTKKNFNSYKPKNPKFHKVLANYRWYSFGEQILFPFKLYRAKLDLFHFLHFNVPLLFCNKFIVTIHDLTQRKLTKKASKLPSLIFYFKKLLYFLVIKNALKKAKKIITISSFIKKEIIRYYNIKPEKIIVIYESAE